MGKLREVNKDIFDRIVGRVIIGSPKEGYTSKVAPQSRQIVEDKYGELIKKIGARVPHRHSGIVGAAIVKCALIYGHDKGIEFAAKLNNESFYGNNDPSFLLWNYIQQKKKGGKAQIASEVYNKTLCACRAFCENRTLTGLYPPKDDLFEWENNFEVPKHKIKESIKKPKPVQVEPKVQIEPKLKPKSEFKLPTECQCGRTAFVFRANQKPICGKCFISERDSCVKEKSKH